MPAKRISQRAKAVIEAGHALGFTVTRTAGDHLRFSKPGCEPVFASGTPGDRRAVQNAVSALRRSARGRKV